MTATTFDFRKYLHKTTGIDVLGSSFTTDAFIGEYRNSSKSSSTLNRFDEKGVFPAWNVRGMGCLDGVPVASSSNDDLFFTIGIIAGNSC